MVLISPNTVIFGPKYSHLKFLAKKRQSFGNNLIYNHFLFSLFHVDQRSCSSGQISTAPDLHRPLCSSNCLNFGCLFTKPATARFHDGSVAVCWRWRNPCMLYILLVVRRTAVRGLRTLCLFFRHANSGGGKNWKLALSKSMLLFFPSIFSNFRSLKLKARKKGPRRADSIFYVTLRYAYLFVFFLFYFSTCVGSFRSFCFWLILFDWSKSC